MATGARAQNRRDRAVRSYVRRELHAHTEAAREQLGGTHFDARQFRSLGDLRKVPPVDLADVGDGARHVLQPTREQLLRSASPFMRARTAWASTWGNWRRFMAVIEPSYRPVHFFNAGGVAIGASAKDLVRLAQLGAVWVRALGVHSDDTVALLEGAKGAVEPWELSGGTRRAGVPLVVVEDPADTSTTGCTVIAGTADAVLRSLAVDGWPQLRLVVVFGPDAADVAERVAELALDDRVAVRRAWAVRGARSVWFECTGGPERGWHTNADAEVVEIDEDDEVLWTGLGWAGTVFLRLRTDVRATTIDKNPCPACGHRGPRVFVADGSPALARWLRTDSRVAEFRLTASGADVLPVRAGANARLVSDVAKAFPGQTVVVKTKRAWAS